MARVLGGMDILNLALPTGVDGARIAQWELRANYTWGSFLSSASNALGQLNTDLMSKWGWLIGLTEEQYFEYRNGGAVTSSPNITDVDFPDPTHGTTIAHMIDLLVYGETVGGTPRFFRNGREATILAAIQEKVDSLTWRYETKLLERLFLPTEYSVGTAGYNVGFVNAGAGSVDYAPVAYGGEAFATTHDHYNGIDSGSYGYDDMLNQLAEHLEEHGHAEPFTAVVARADIASYSALSGFVKFVNPVIDMVDRGTTTADTGAAFFARQNAMRELGVIGGFQSDYGYVELRATNRVPTKYAALVKSYGMNSPRNPLAVRVDPAIGFGARITAQSGENDLDRIKRLLIEMEYGVGVGPDRTNGVVGYLVSGGTWVDPTIS